MPTLRSSFVLVLMLAGLMSVGLPPRATADDAPPPKEDAPQEEGPESAEAEVMRLFDLRDFEGRISANVLVERIKAIAPMATVELPGRGVAILVVRAPARNMQEITKVLRKLRTNLIKAEREEDAFTNRIYVDITGAGLKVEALQAWARTNTPDLEVSIAGSGRLLLALQGPAPQVRTMLDHVNRARRAARREARRARGEAARDERLAEEVAEALQDNVELIEQLELALAVAKRAGNGQAVKTLESELTLARVRSNVLGGTLSSEERAKMLAEIAKRVGYGQDAVRDASPEEADGGAQAHERKWRIRILEGRVLDLEGQVEILKGRVKALEAQLAEDR